MIADVARRDICCLEETCRLVDADPLVEALRLEKDGGIHGRCTMGNDLSKYWNLTMLKIVDE
jgi:hypothetical protein